MKIPYIKEKFVNDLIKLCKETMLIAQPNNDSNSIHIQKLARDILVIKKDIEDYYKALIQAIPNQQIELLCSIPGVGIKTATALIVLIGNIKNFKSGKKLASYFGVHPVSNNSGIVEKSRMSKQGNPYGRRTLYSIVFQMYKKSSYFYPYFNDLVNKFQGKKLKAVGAMMNKICCIIWSMLFYNTKFDCDRFKRDREKRSQLPCKKEQNLQEFFKDNNLTQENWVAPLSNKMKKKFEVLKKREPQDDKSSSTGSSRPSDKNENIENLKNSQGFS